MRKVLFLVLLCISASSIPAQSDTSRSAGDSLLSDSARMAMKSQRDSFDRIYDQRMRAESDEAMQRNLDSFVRMRKEQDAKAKKAAIIRIAIGVGFLIILVIGLMRKRKKK